MHDDDPPPLLPLGCGPHRPPTTFMVRQPGEIPPGPRRLPPPDEVPLNVVRVTAHLVKPRPVRLHGQRQAYDRLRCLLHDRL